MAQITFTWTGVDAALMKLDRIANFPMHRFLDALGEKSASHMREYFEKGAGPDGTWAPLSDATLSINPRRSGGQVLRDSGTLGGSISHDVGAFQVEIGTNVPYGEYHQEGPRHLNIFGKGIAGTLPVRRFLGWDAAGKDMIEGAARAFIAVLIK